jgi:hypothetical protein
MALVADEDHIDVLIGELSGFIMDFCDERAGGVNGLKLPLCGPAKDSRGYAVRTEDDPAAIGYGVDVIHENNTACFEAVDDGCIVDDLMKDVQGCAMGFECAFYDLDGARHACAKALCACKKDLH